MILLEWLHDFVGRKEVGGGEGLAGKFGEDGGDQEQRGMELGNGRGLRVGMGEAFHKDLCSSYVPSNCFENNMVDHLMQCLFISINQCIKHQTELEQVM